MHMSGNVVVELSINPMNMFSSVTLSPMLRSTPLCSIDYASDEVVKEGRVIQSILDALHQFADVISIQ